MSISKEDFNSLKSGDVIVWARNPDKPYFRTIIEGPADTGRTGIYLPIRHRSWTARSHTVYAWNDVKHFISKTSIKRDSIFTDEELEIILSQGLKPKWDLEWCISEAHRLAKLGMGRCSLNACKKARRALKALTFAEIS